MQFTLPKLFLALTMAAVAFAGMAIRTTEWSQGICTFTALLYLIVGIRAIGLRREERASAIAFSFAGGGYMLLVTCILFSLLGGSLATNYPLALIARANDFSGIPGTPPVTGYMTPYGVPVAVSQSSSIDEVILAGLRAGVTITPLARFFLIGHCAWSWIVALLAGWLAGWTYARREKLQSV